MACCKKVYTVPTFPISAAIYTGTMLGTPGALRFITPCQLVFPELSMDQFQGFPANTLHPAVMYALFPKLTDLRTVVCGPMVFNDFAQIPPGSTRLYEIRFVDDRWRGFQSEHRVAMLVQTVGPLFPGWGFPIP